MLLSYLFVYIFTDFIFVDHWRLFRRDHIRKTGRNCLICRFMAQRAHCCLEKYICLFGNLCRLLQIVVLGFLLRIQHDIWHFQITIYFLSSLILIKRYYRSIVISILTIQISISITICNQISIAFTLHVIFLLICEFKVLHHIHNI